MSLFASFAMLLNFPRHNKMNGMGQIVTWSVRDESLHCEGIIKLFHEWNRETGAVTPRCATTSSMSPGPWSGWRNASSISPSALGGIDGMDAADIKAYVRYIADWRLTQLRLPPVFGYFAESESGYASSSRIRCPGWSKSSTASSTPISSSSAPPSTPRRASRGSWDGADGVWAAFDAQRTPPTERAGRQAYMSCETLPSARS